MVTAPLYKVVSSLPTPLEPNALYAVRVGNGFSLYITNSSGEAKSLNKMSVVTYNNQADFDAAIPSEDQLIVRI